MVKSESFCNLETVGGILLFIAAVLAVLVANSPLLFAHERHVPITCN